MVRPTVLRNAMSAATTAPMPGRGRAATTATAPRSRSNAADRRFTASVAGELPQLRAGLRRALDDRLPGGLDRLLAEGLGLGGPEIEWRNAGAALALDLRRNGRDILRVQAFDPQRRVVEHL